MLRKTLKHDNVPNIRNSGGKDLSIRGNNTPKKYGIY